MIDPIAALALIVAFGLLLMVIVAVGERHDKRTADTWRRIYDQDNHR